MDYVTKIMAYEAGELSYDEMIELFQYLVNTGIINHLQGSYGRWAQELIEEGLISP